MVSLGYGVTDEIYGCGFDDIGDVKSGGTTKKVTPKKLNRIVTKNMIQYIYEDVNKKVTLRMLLKVPTKK